MARTVRRAIDSPVAQEDNRSPSSRCPCLARAALPRHQTLRTAIEWSHDLLEPPERTLLRRLSVFAGRFTLADAESVCGATLDSISSLVEKSLVVMEGSSFRLHETMREYAAAKLVEAGEQETAEEQLAEHYWSECVSTGFGARYRLDEWLPWIELEIDNGSGETLNDSGVRHLRVEVQKNTPFSRLIERLSERVKKP